MVEHGQGIGDTHHHFHVVLDEQDRDPALADLADQPHQRGGFGRIGAGGGLIQE
jgi:hypothetical protein